MDQENPFANLLTSLTVGEQTYKYYDLNKLEDPRIKHLPVSIKVLLECAIRNCDGFSIKAKDVENIVAWEETSKQNVSFSSLSQT